MTPAAAKARAIPAPVPTPVLSESAPAASPFLTLGFFCFCFYIFALYSRALDLTAPRLHLPGINFAVAIVMAVLSGRIIETFQHRIAVLMVALTFWLMVATAGSSWRGGSVTVLTRNWIPALALFLVGATVIATTRQCRRSLYVFGLAAAAGAALVVLRGRFANDRLVLEGSKFANSNTIAIVLLVGMPMVWMLATGARASMIRKIFVAVVLIVMTVALFRTASREGLVGFAILLLTAFVRSSIGGKIRMAVVMLVLIAGTVMFLPRSLKVRFGTIFEYEKNAQSSERAITQSAAESSAIRWKLLIASLQLTKEHPILGVGPGQFAPFLANKANASIMASYWVGTHNTYTQLSSEAGLPALGLYLAMLAASMLTLARIYRRAKAIPGNEAREIAAMTVALHSSFVAFCVCALFNHMAYDLTMPLMASMAMGMARTAPAELTRLEMLLPNQITAGNRPAKLPPLPRYPALASRLRFPG